MFALFDINNRRRIFTISTSNKTKLVIKYVYLSSFERLGTNILVSVHGKHIIIKMGESGDRKAPLVNVTIEEKCTNLSSTSFFKIPITFFFCVCILFFRNYNIYSPGVKDWVSSP